MLQSNKCLNIGSSGPGIQAHNLLDMGPLILTAKPGQEPIKKI